MRSGAGIALLRLQRPGAQPDIDRPGEHRLDAAAAAQARQDLDGIAGIVFGEPSAEHFYRSEGAAGAAQGQVGGLTGEGENKEDGGQERHALSQAGQVSHTFHDGSPDLRTNARAHRSIPSGSFAKDERP